jgi:hypothetical protein
MSGQISPRRVVSLPASVAPKRPVGHLHVHLGPMIPFETLWVRLWSTFLLRGSLESHSECGIDSIGGGALPEIGRSADERRPGLRWQWILELAFATRATLAQELDGDLLGPLPAALRDFEQGQVDSSRRTKGLLSFGSEEHTRRWTHREARRLTMARINAHRAEVRLQRLTQGEPGHLRPRNVPPDVEGEDELLFMTRALTRCGSRGNGTDSFARRFYQYLRVKVALYGRLVVDPWAAGLEHFLDVVVRDKVYADVIDDKVALDDARLIAARRESPLSLRALEIHIPPESWIKRGDERKPRQSWILSFVRSPKAKAMGSGGIDAAKRWRRHAAHVATVCRFLGRRIEARPTLLRYLRALSLMDSERNGPAWLFEGQFRRLLRISSAVAAKHPALNLSPLRTALHLGEDFDHILSGLRQIYEPFAWNLIGRGDRIGHALALGLVPASWCKQTQKVRMRPWDRILDIGFVSWAHSALGVRLEADTLLRLRESVAEALHRMFRAYSGDPLEVARNIWLALPTSLPAGSTITRDQLDAARQRIDELLDVSQTGRRGLSRSLVVDASLDLPVIETVHQLVHRHVAVMQVAVEVNPSSNLLVGGFRSVFDQPIFHFKDLPIIINADDPLTFATTLADDYAYAWAGMVLMQNVKPHDATARLEEAAECSTRYGFNGPDVEGRLPATIGTSEASNS